MVLNITGTIRLISGGEKGRKRVRRLGGEVDLSLQCHHQNDFCIKMGSEESHFNVSLIIVKDKITSSVYRPQPLKRKESQNGFEPKSLCLPA